MQYTVLGKTDIKITRTTFGCWEMGGTKWEFTDDANNIRIIHTALDKGVTTFDTAEAYGDGHSEQVLGEALKGRRGQCVVASKVAPNHLRSGDLRAAAQRSLKNLGMDYMDIYYIHWPNAEIPLEETMGEMLRLKQEGLIRAIGVSNFNADLLKQALALGRVDAVQSEYSLLQRDIEKELIPLCLEERVSIASYSSVAKGILTGIFHLGGVKLADDDFRAPRRLFLKKHLEAERALIDAMKELSDAKGVLLSQLAVAWLLRKKGLSTAIVGTQNEGYLLENLAAFEIELSDADMIGLDEVSARVIREIDGENF